MNVIGYVRVSTEEQAREGVSIDMQVAKLAAYCEAHDHNLVEVVAETASAKTLERRGIDRVFAALLDDTADAVLIYKLDRLTRSVVDFGRLLAVLEKHGKALLSVRDSLDTSSAAGRLVIHIMVSVSQWERETISERTKDALHSKRERGERLGRPQVGWQVIDGHLVPNDRYWIVERVHRLRDAGMTIDGIVEDLNSNDIPTGSGRGRWHRGSVHRYLNAPLEEDRDPNRGRVGLRTGTNNHRAVA